MVIKRVGPVSCAKVVGLLYTILGLVFGAIVSMLSLAGSLASESAQNAGFGAMIGVGAIVLFPLMYGGLGFVMTLIGAALYNAVAGAVGGIEMDLQ